MVNHLIGTQMSCWSRVFTFLLIKLVTMFEKPKFWVCWLLLLLLFLSINPLQTRVTAIQMVCLVHGTELFRLRVLFGPCFGPLWHHSCEIRVLQLKDKLIRGIKFSNGFMGLIHWLFEYWLDMETWSIDPRASPFENSCPWVLVWFPMHNLLVQLNTSHWEWDVVCLTLWNGHLANEI